MKRIFTKRRFIRLSASHYLLGLLAIMLFVGFSGTALASMLIDIAPPPFPVYYQPPPPASSYIWAPGYWAYGLFGYYWVPGTWVLAPYRGLLWTPGYWGWRIGQYYWHPGYWAPHIGFYGGVPYGFGFDGVGFNGGNWSNGRFVNRYYNHVTNITNVTNNISNVSYNGGPGGVKAAPTGQQQVFAHERHYQPTPLQRAHIQAAQQNHNLLFSANHGKPPIAATPRPRVFTGAVAALNKPYINVPREQTNKATEQKPAAIEQANPHVERNSETPNSENPKNMTSPEANKASAHPTEEKVQQSKTPEPAKSSNPDRDQPNPGKPDHRPPAPQIQQNALQQHAQQQQQVQQARHNAIVAAQRNSALQRRPHNPGPQMQTRLQRRPNNPGPHMQPHPQRQHMPASSQSSNPGPHRGGGVGNHQPPHER